MTLRTGEDTVNWRRKLSIAICGGIVLEEVLDLSFDRLLMMIFHACKNFPKVEEPPQNFWLEKDDTKRVSYWEQILGANVPNLIAMATLRPRFVHFCLYYLSWGTLTYSACRDTLRTVQVSVNLGNCGLSFYLSWLLTWPRVFSWYRRLQFCERWGVCF